MAVDALKQLPLQQLSEGWVTSVWDSDFTETELPEDYAVDVVELFASLKCVKTSLNSWVTSSEQEEGLFTHLVENDVSLKAVIAFLASLICTANQRTSDFSKKEAGIVAAGIYVRVVTLPGSSAFHVFHPEIFEKCVDLLKQMTAIAGNNKRKRSVTPGEMCQKRSAKSKRKRTNRNSSVDEHDEEDVSGDEDEEEMLPQHRTSLKQHLHKLLAEVVNLLELFPLRQSLSSARHTVNVLSVLTRVDIEIFDGHFNSRHPLEKLSIPALAFKGLQLLCTQLHGNIGQLMNVTCKQLLGSLLMLVDEKAVQTITKPLLLIRDHTLNFLLILMKQCGERGQVCCRTLVQHLCTKVPDKAEYRPKIVAVVIQIICELTAENYSRMVHWFYKLSKHATISYRGFAVEIVTALLSAPATHTAADIPGELKQFTSHRFLLTILLDRCSDSAASVRSRAITCFSQCLASRDKSVAQSMKDIVTPIAGSRPDVQFLVRTPATVTDEGEGSQATELMVNQQEPAPAVCNTIATEQASIQTEEASRGTTPTPLLQVQLTPGCDASLADKDGVFSLLRRRAKDEKVLVRKAALQALESAVRFEFPQIRKENVEVLRDHCRDPGLVARKQAMQSLTDLLKENSTDKTLQSLWLSGILPLVLDRESTLQEKCMDTMEELILGSLRNSRQNRMRDKDSCLAWSLLAIMAEPSNVDQRRYLQKACHHWSRQGKIKPALISALESNIGTEENSAAWMMLALLAPAVQKIDHHFILNYWHNRADRGCSSEDLERMLTVIKCIAKHIPTEERARLIFDIKESLLRFDSPSEIITVSVSTLEKLCNVQADQCREEAWRQDWCRELISACDQYLSAAVLEENSGRLEEDKVVCHLLTLGEVVQLCPNLTSRHIFLLVQSLITRPAKPSSQRASEGERSAEFNKNGTSDMMDHSGGSQMSQQSGSSQGTKPLSQFTASNLSNRLRAFAFISLGKLCLQHENLAKKCVAALARELETSTDPVIRNNVVIVLCDLCVRYTTIANHYISNIATCLKDGSALVRKQTLTLITRLLQEDFLKWKGALFYRFISTLLDDCAEIRTFAETCLVHMLIQRHPNMFFQHFMECIFHFNDFTEHTVYNKFTQSEKDRDMFSLKGEENAGKRLQLYRFLLEYMTDNQRFQIQDKLCQEVLGGIVDGILALTVSSGALLKDSLAVLVCKEIKLSSLKVQRDEVTDEQEMAAVVVATAKKNIITQVVKKNVIETIVPIVVGLKHLLEKERSPLIKNLMVYLQELMKDYKTEVKDILSADRQLATEIEFDLRKFEEETASTQRTETTNVQAPVIEVQPVQAVSDALSSPQRPVAGTAGSSSPQVTSVGSPKTPRMHQPGVAERRRSGPVNNLAPSLKALQIGETTPDRRESLSRFAVMNSVRQAGQPGDRETGIRASKNSNMTENTQSQNDGSKENIMTPYQRNRRAISTPSVVLKNITFHMDADMTFVPPSPILEAEDDACHYFNNDDGAAVTPGRDRQHVQQTDRGADCEGTGAAAKDVIVFSLNLEAPRPQIWNVTSPAPEKRGRQRSNSKNSNKHQVDDSPDTPPRTRRTSRQKNKR